MLSGFIVPTHSIAKTKAHKDRTFCFESAQLVSRIEWF